MSYKSITAATDWFYSWPDAGGSKRIKPVAAFALDGEGNPVVLLADEGLPGGLKPPHAGTSGICIHASQLTETQRAAIKINH